MKYIYFFIITLMSFNSVPCELEIEDLARCFLTAVIDKDVDAIKSIYNNTDFDSSIFIDDSVHGDKRFKSIRSVLLNKEIMINIRENTDGSAGPGSYLVTYIPKIVAKSFEELKDKEKNGQATMFVDYIVCEINVDDSGVFMPHPCFFGFDFNEF